MTKSTLPSPCGSLKSDLQAREADVHGLPTRPEKAADLVPDPLCKGERYAEAAKAGRADQSL